MVYVGTELIEKLDFMCVLEAHNIFVYLRTILEAL